MKRFELLNKDVVVLTFAYDDELHRIATLSSVADARFAPPALIGPEGGISLKALVRWWSRRSIPASRAQINRLKSAFSIDDMAVLLEKNFALSLSDRYWVREVGSDVTWEAVNFFDNDFSDDLGILTLDPSSSVAGTDLGSIDLMNPNSSVGGDLPKKWVIENGRRYLLKNGIQYFGQDVFNEVVATALCARLLPTDRYVAYDLVSSGGETYCRCEEFLAPNEELVTVDDLLQRHAHDRDFGTYLSVLRALRETGIGEDQLSEGLTQLFTVDFLMANSDRHTNNFGVIRDCETLEYKRLAPIFDTGFSLWCDKRRLSVPSDFDYSPRPFTNTTESPLRQLRLFDSYDWFDEAALDGWAAEARAILAQDELIPEERLAAVEKNIALKVATCCQHVQKMRAFKAGEALR